MALENTDMVCRHNDLENGTCVFTKHVLTTASIFENDTAEPKQVYARCWCKRYTPGDMTVEEVEA